MDIEKTVKSIDRYRRMCLNLQASENMILPEALSLLSSDLSGRYWHEDESGTNSYGGIDSFRDILREGERCATRLFGAEFAEIRPIGGHIAAAAVLRAITRPGDTIMHIPSRSGGYPGYDQRYLPDLLSLKSIEIPFTDETQDIDMSELEVKVKNARPSVIILGQSAFVKPYDLKSVSGICSENGIRLVYDGSHVMGLIAGKAFQPDTLDYSDVLVGSTHKTMPGPQGGIILTNDAITMEKIRGQLTWTLQDNFHLARVASLALTLQKMISFAEAYARRVVRNSYELGKTLYELSMGIRFSPWFSHSHQIIVDDKWLSEKGLNRVEFSRTLERNNIIVDRDGRIGTSEISRMGYEDMQTVADLMVSAISGKNIREDVISVAEKIYGGT